jgi:hypothetical protein
MRRICPHNSTTIPSERFNKIKDYDYDWRWEYNSVVVFGGGGVSFGATGSKFSDWDSDPKDHGKNITARAVCCHEAYDI